MANHNEHDEYAVQMRGYRAWAGRRPYDEQLREYRAWAERRSAEHAPDAAAGTGDCFQCGQPVEEGPEAQTWTAEVPLNDGSTCLIRLHHPSCSLEWVKTLGAYRWSTLARR